METPFVDPGDCNHAQLAFLTGVYAVVLYQASGLISGGSELLMLVPSVAGLVGSIVLPILGAVPDGMMVLFSGVGPNAQETVAVGVGALAGSTVMLLTFPWFICILFGRVPYKDGKPDWSNRVKPGLCDSGISFQPSIRSNCRIMLATTLLYLIIQLPATSFEQLGMSTKEQGESEHTASLVGLFACIGAFVGYLIYCFKDATEDKQLAEIIKGIDTRQISIVAALEFINHKKSQSQGKEAKLIHDEQLHRLRKICRHFFRRFDADGDNRLKESELGPHLRDLGLPQKAGRQIMADHDINKDGVLSFEEFTACLLAFMNDPRKMAQACKAGSTVGSQLAHHVAYGSDDEEEEEDMPEDIAQIPKERQMARVVFRSIWMMALGTVLVLAFSDPMVDCLSEWGNRLGISAFYISFVLAPFASNASELLSAYTYAKKKTEKNMTTSLSTLVGAACMNNTFVLAIFLALIYIQGLAWQFTAETIAMVLIQWIIGLVAIGANSQGMVSAVLILLCYPGCLFIVWFLENKIGLD